MASTIQIKRGTGSAVPSGLADGELAINLDNGQLYFGSGSTSVNSFRFTNLTADNYIVSSSVTNITTQTLSGSTEFGDSVDDEHTFTGNITASGKISASGMIMGGPIIGRDYVEFGNTSGNRITPISSTQYDLQIGSVSKVNVYNTLVRTTTPLQVGIDSGDYLLVKGDITTDGDVSASGVVYAEDAIVQDLLTVGRIRTAGADSQISLQGSLDGIANITASGNISASGEVITNLLRLTPGVNDYLRSTGTAVALKSANNSLQLYGNITASGNISASGTIIGSNLTNVENTAISTFAGTSNITTVGTIGTGTWNGSVIASAKLDTDTAHLSTTQTFTGAKTFSANPTLSGTTKLIAEDMEAIHNDGSQLVISQDNRISKLRGTSFNVDTNITASGDISSSGYILGNRYFVNGKQLGYAPNKVYLSDGAEETMILGTNIELNAPVTASGNISASGTIIANSIIGTVGTATQGTIDHDSLANFVANEHIDHSGVSITAGAGLTGGGTIASTRDIAVGAGTGVTINANDVAIGQDVATTANVLFNHITASGNISASGDIYSNRYYAKEQLALNNVNGAITLGYDNTYPINIGKVSNPIGIYGPVTASGHISASGNNYASEYYTDGYSSLNTSGTQGRVFSAAGITGIQIGRNGSPNKNIELLGPVTASGNISASGTITANSIIGTVGTATQGTIDHDSLANFVANEHIDHSGVSVIAGTGLTGGGTIAANRTLNVIGGTGVTANANDIAIGQDVATTANVLFNHITSSGDISASLNSKLYASSASFGGAAFLRSFNVKGAGLEGRLSLQGASTNDNPGIEMTVNDNTSRVLMRLNPIGSNGTELAIFTEPDGGSIAEAITVESDGNLELNSHDIKGVNKLVVDGGQDEVLKLNTTSATGNPFIDFSQNGSRKSFIQHNDTNNTLKIASEFGAISLQTATDGNQTERVSISNVSASFTVPVKDGGRTIVKILPHNFVANDGGRPVMIEDDAIGSNELFAFSHSDFDMYAYIEIPYGMTATHAKIFGSNTGENFIVYEANFNTKTIAQKCSATAINSLADITDVPWTDSNYLVILVTSAGATDEIHGGFVTITPS